MSNSSLVSFTRISPNSSRRTAKIDTITIHHMACNLSIEECGAGFSLPSRGASSNYGIGSDGRIGLYVEESRRSHCSSSTKNDNRAVTMEVANDTRAPEWHVSDAALESTIALCVDICRRNNIPRLNFTGDKSGNLTMHKWFWATECPGPYLGSKFQYITDEVNRRLGVSDPEQNAPEEDQEENTAQKPENAAALAVGDVITLVPGTRYTTGKAVPEWVMKKTLYCRAINGSNVTFSILKTGGITGVTSAANVRKGGQAVTDTVVKEDKPRGFNVGDAVSLISGAKYINGKSVPAWVIRRTVYVRQIYSNGNIVFSIFQTGPVTGVVTEDNLVKN